MNLIRVLLICRKHDSIWQNFYINGRTKGSRGSVGRNYPLDAIETLDTNAIEMENTARLTLRIMMFQWLDYE